MEIPLVKIELRPSKMLKGEVGLFAVKNIQRDEVVIEAEAFDETPHPWSEFEKLDDVTQQKILGFCSATEEFFYAPPNFNHLPTNWYMNHSCEPNVGFDKHDNFVAMRDIKKDEELSWDYCFNETNPKFSMECKCGAEKCRHTITGSDWKFLVKDTAKYPYLTEDLREHARING